MKLLKPWIVLLCLGALALPLTAGAEPAVFTADGAAIRGYDPVAYFTVGEPTRGSREFSTRWNGADWYFATAENLAVFEAEPAAYAPQYGGWCAYAMSRGRYATTDPQAWTIVDDKLYLNYSPSVKRKWLKDRDAHIAKADRHWARLQGEG